METLEDQQKLCVVTLDEISLKSNLKCQSNSDELVGLEDYGHLGKTKNKANHALVFMLRGIQVKW